MELVRGLLVGPFRPQLAQNGPITATFKDCGPILPVDDGFSFGSSGHTCLAVFIRLLV